MKTVRLGFKAFDLHELLPFMVARDAGLFERENLRITLTDTSLPNQNTSATPDLSVACGAATLNFLRGKSARIVLVACSEPLFHLCVNDDDLRDFSDLHGKTIASYPGPSPPGLFLRYLLQDGEIDAELRETRTDEARLGLLGTDDVDAALVSSAVSRGTLERFDVNRLVTLGDRLRVPTTGLAVNGDGLTNRNEILQGLVAVFREGLSLIRDDPDASTKTIQRHLGQSPEDARKSYEFVKNYFSGDGTLVPGTVEDDLKELARFMDLTPPSEVDPLFDFSFLSKR